MPAPATGAPHWPQVQSPSLSGALQLGHSGIRSPSGAGFSGRTPCVGPPPGVYRLAGAEP